MRWIFFTLLAANVALAAWWYWAPPAPSASGNVSSYQPAQGVPRLKLLSELQGPPVAPAETPAPPVEPPAPPQAEAPSADANPYRQCAMLGPYENAAEAESALQRAKAVESKAHLHNLDIFLSANFQVYLPPFANRSQAKQKLDELQARGLDSYIIPKGELANGIALGSFEQEVMAKEQQSKLSGQGISAQIRENKRPIRELWLAFPPDMGDKLPAPLKTSLMAGNTRLEERQILCSALASP
jgi:cell division septation protein DedD